MGEDGQPIKEELADDPELVNEAVEESKMESDMPELG
jgi:hypothetical protein